MWVMCEDEGLYLLISVIVLGMMLFSLKLVMKCMISN